MAQANEKPARRKNRYYWIRLKENFFEDDRIRIIASVPNGDSILIFYLKLMLKSIQGEGELFKDSGIDCTPRFSVLSLAQIRTSCSERWSCCNRLT